MINYKFSNIRFYFLIFIELLFSPFLYSYNFYKYNFVKFNNSKIRLKKRSLVYSKSIEVCIHEWGGYDSTRIKQIKNSPQFNCGLRYQLTRFKFHSNNYFFKLTLTISDIHLFNEKIDKSVNILSVSNRGMDFSGFSTFYNTLNFQENKYVILTNSSVNAIQNDFIDGYINYLESNPTVGLLGISYNTKIYQSLIFNNFNPHIQSFFLMTTTDILRELVNINKNIFPGVGITNKRLLIRDGEVKFSQLILDLGYELSCVLEDGSVYKFNKYCKIDNGKNSWKIQKGDYRLKVINPNKINLIS